MDLTTNYMGLKLKNPLVVSSNNLTGTADNVKLFAENGAGAVVLKSLFEEQIIVDSKRLMRQDEMYFWYPEAIGYLSNFSKEDGIDEYLELIKNSKKLVDIPVIASINCITAKDWPVFASRIEEAGADGLELNISISPFDIKESSVKTEETYYNIIGEVIEKINIPLAIKIGYYFSNPFDFILKLSKTGIDGMVLFNRFFRPDIDIENIRLITSNVFSAPEELTLSLRWIALLAGKVDCSLAAATGIHDYVGVAKQILAGASCVQLCSTLYKNGPEYLQVILSELESWMKKHKYNKIDDFKGLICREEENAAAFERVQFMMKTTGKY